MEDFTQLLGAAAAGDRGAAARILPLVYDDLRRQAAAKMRREAAGHTLQPTALVHEAYIRLFGGTPNFANRAHFFAAAAEAMRRILVERARRQKQLKRGGGRGRAEIPDDVPDPRRAGGIDCLDVLAVHEALDELEQFDKRMADIVKLRCFVGMSIAEVAESLELSSRTVNREWLLASAWLSRKLGPRGDSPEISSHDATEDRTSA
ncbi:MAG TPA: ECF-type sigma factor [Tepidisphaeraceae bacterium]|nr:ECF-type sigma factor [Tepidisphaeraceae bacterium]